MAAFKESGFVGVIVTIFVVAYAAIALEHPNQDQQSLRAVAACDRLRSIDRRSRLIDRQLNESLPPRQIS